MKNHLTWMLVGCLGILLLLFLLPVIGINSSNSLFIFMIIFFVAHLFIMGSTGDMMGTEAIPARTVTKKINLKTKTIMQNINIKKFALAWGVAGVVFYLGCIILMTTVGREGTILFFNSLLHGLDTSAIIRMDVPWTEALIGLVEMFILGWLFGALIASVYNISFNKKARG